jgi:hypothetical protein
MCCFDPVINRFSPGIPFFLLWLVECTPLELDIGIRYNWATIWVTRRLKGIVPYGQKRGKGC